MLSAPTRKPGATSAAEKVHADFLTLTSGNVLAMARTDSASGQPLGKAIGQAMRAK